MRKYFKFILITLSILILVGCGSSSSPAVAGGSSSFNEMSYDSYDYKEENYLEESHYVDMDAYDPETNTFAGKKIIYYGDATLESKNYREDLAAIEKLISDNEVMITASNEDDYDDMWYSSNSKYYGSWGKVKSYTLRIPIKNFDNFVNGLDNVGAHIKNKNISSNDVTKKYNDNETKIKSLEIQQDRLLELLGQAQNVTEILEIEDRLTEVRYQLESLNNSNNQIDYDVEFSEFNLTLREVNRYSTDNYSFWERFIDSFGESLSNFASWIGDLVIWLIFAAPFIILISLIIFIINLIRVKQGKEKLNFKKLIQNSDGNIGLNKIAKFLGLIIIIMILIAVLGNIFNIL